MASHAFGGRAVAAEEEAPALAGDGHRAVVLAVEGVAGQRRIIVLWRVALRPADERVAEAAHDLHAAVGTTTRASAGGRPGVVRVTAYRIVRPGEDGEEDRAYHDIYIIYPAPAMAANCGATPGKNALHMMQQGDFRVPATSRTFDAVRDRAKVFVESPAFGYFFQNL